MISFIFLHTPAQKHRRSGLLKDHTDTPSGDNMSINSRYETILEGFRHLQTLILSVPHAAESEFRHHFGVANETIDFLLAAKHLSSLDLEFGDDNFSDGGPVLQHHLEHLFDGSQEGLWPQLRHLTLSTKIRSPGFLRFLEQHSSTLKSLELRDMEVCNVPYVFEQIPKLLKLERVYMECVWSAFEPEKNSQGCFIVSGSDHDDDYERSVKAYLLGEREDLVVLRDEGGGVRDDSETDDGP